MCEMKIKRDFFVVVFSFVFSFGLGIVTHDIWIGGTTLFTGLLGGYYMAKGEKINYLYGMVNYILLGYIAFKNYLYGVFLFYLFLFAPLQIQGFFTWEKKSVGEDKFEIKSFTFKNSIVILVLCILGSMIVGYLLNLLPLQQLAFVDATSNCINLCGMVLMMLQFKESWWLWFINNVLDLIISIHCVLHNGENSIMMLATAIAFIVINILGLIQWNKIGISKNK